MTPVLTYLAISLTVAILGAISYAKDEDWSKKSTEKIALTAMLVGVLWPLSVPLLLLSIIIIHFKDS